MVGVAVAVKVAVNVGVWVAVGVFVGMLVGVQVGVAVAVFDGVSVAVRVSVGTKGKVAVFVPGASVGIEVFDGEFSRVGAAASAVTGVKGGSLRLSSAEMMTRTATTVTNNETRAIMA